MNSMIIPTFSRLFTVFAGCFSKPTFASFQDLAIGWILTPGKKTVVNIMRTMGDKFTKSHDAYQKFFSKQQWETDEVNKHLFGSIVLKLVKSEKILIAGDDTLCKHYGTKMFGIGIFRDPVRSTPKRPSFVRAHNWVILYVLLRAPWTNTFLALPICSRLRPKQKKKSSKNKKKKSRRGVRKKTDQTMVDLMKEMVELVVNNWAPERNFEFVTDGAYACLLGNLPERVRLVSRIRKDAKLFALPPKRKTGQRGRPRKKGIRLPSPLQTAQTCQDWQDLSTVIYGHQVQLQICAYQGLWYHVSKNKLITILIVRDPNGKHQDQFFFTDDLQMDKQHMITIFSARWSVEVAHKELKQHMGIEDPQSRLEKPVKRQAPFAMLLLSLIKAWYLIDGHQYDIFKDQTDPWYKHKQGICFSDMLRLLRYHSWRQSIFSCSNFRPEMQKILSPFIDIVARGA